MGSGGALGLPEVYLRCVREDVVSFLDDNDGLAVEHRCPSQGASGTAA
jgi:hypothetical protein